MSLKLLEEVLILVDYALGVAIVSCEVMALNGLTSLFFYLTFFVSTALWLCTLFEEVRLVDLLVLLTIVIALANVLINSASTRTTVTFDYLKKLLMFSCTLMFLVSATKVHVKDRTIGIIALMCVFAVIVMTYSYFRYNSAMHYIEGRVSAYLTFRFTNPNLTALFLSCIIMIVGLRGFQKSQLPFKIVYYVAAIVSIVFLVETKCRNAMLAIGVFFFSFAVLNLFDRRNARIPKWLFAVGSVFPILFAQAYITLITNPLFNDALSFMVGEGKGLSSRSQVWSEAIEGFWQSPVLGAYSQISGGTGLSQLHNTHLDVLASYGIIVLALTCVLLYIFMSDSWDRGSTETRAVALTGFISTLLLGVGEAALFSGGLAIYLFMGFFLMYATQEEQITDEILKQPKPLTLAYKMPRDSGV